MSNYKLGLDFAKEQDQNDEFSSYRSQFHIPKDNNGNELIYMTGNSLGLQPKITKYILTIKHTFHNLSLKTKAIDFCNGR